MYNYEIKTTDTAEQLTVFGWCEEIGLTVLLEYNVPPYYLDIYLPELKLAVELDGPMHSRKRDKKRDGFIKRRHGIDVWRFRNRDITDTFQKQFNSHINKRAKEIFDAKD